MDGLMIDSQPLHRMAFDEVFKKYGKRLTTQDDNQFYVGLSDKDAAIDMVKRYSLPISADILIKQKQKRYMEFLSHEIIPQKGLLILLEQLHKNGYKSVIASGCNLDEIKTIINSLKINDYIQGYFSAEQVNRGKPSPDLFLFAAKEMGFDPSECLVLEDAPSGINAAKSAGMKSFAIPSRETREKNFSNATKILDSLTEVFENLKTL